MKGFILAAGKGTRLRPLTDSIPKCLVPIQGKPMLAIWLEWCQQYGIDDVIVNLHAHADKVQEYLDQRDCPVRVDIAYEPSLLGSAGTLRANRRFVELEREFVVMYADVLTNMNPLPMLQLHQRSGGAATIGLYQVSNPTECGIVELEDDNRVKSFEEKPRSPKSTLAFSGVLIGSPALLDVIPRRYPVDLGFEILPKLTGQMNGYQLGASEYLADIGTMEKYEAAQNAWLGLQKDHTALER